MRSDEYMEAMSVRICRRGGCGVVVVLFRLLEFDLSSSMVLENSPRNMERVLTLGGSTGSRTTVVREKASQK